LALSQKIFPLTAVVGLEDVKRLLLLGLVNQSLGPIAILGPPGCGKSTALRSLAELLPTDEYLFGCQCNCEPSADVLCNRCTKVRNAGGERKVERPIPLVTLPFSATPDVLYGKARMVAAPHADLWDDFEPGVLALANGGILTIEKAEHTPKDMLDKVFTALSEGKVTIGVPPRRFTYPFHTMPIFEVDGPVLPAGIKRYCKMVARAVPPATTEGKVLVLKQVQDFDISPDAFMKEHAGQVAALREKVAKARPRFAGLELPDEMMKAAKKKARDIGNPDAWSSMLQAAGAAAAFDDTAITVQTLDEVANFLPTASGGGR